MAKKKTKNNKKQKTMEIVRSFSWKMSLPNYENRDFFASAKLTDVKEKEAETISEKLYNFVKAEVIKSVNSYLAETKKELQLADIKKNKGLWEELKKYFTEHKDEVTSNYGKQSTEEKLEEESKSEVISQELKENKEYEPNTK